MPLRHMQSVRTGGHGRVEHRAIGAQISAASVDVDLGDALACRTTRAREGSDAAPSTLADSGRKGTGARRPCATLVYRAAQSMPRARMVRIA